MECLYVTSTTQASQNHLNNGPFLIQVQDFLTAITLSRPCFKAATTSTPLTLLPTTTTAVPTTSHHQLLPLRIQPRTHGALQAPPRSPPPSAPQRCLFRVLAKKNFRVRVFRIEAAKVRTAKNQSRPLPKVKHLVGLMSLIIFLASKREHRKVHSKSPKNVSSFFNHFSTVQYILTT